MGIELGAAAKFALKKNTNPWGGAALQLGAGDGIEFNSDSLKSNSELVSNNGITGSPFRRPGSSGARKPGGEVSFDLYYRDSLWRALAAVIGADAATLVVTGAYRHDLTAPVSPYTLANFSAAVTGSEVVREMPSCKPTAFKLDWSESDQRGKASVNFVAHDLNYNAGSPDAVRVVANAAAANGAKTLAAQPATPSQITFTLTGVTELVTTLVGTDIDGIVRTEVHTRSTGTLTFLSAYIYKSVASITCASISGAGNFSAGVANGVNNQGTIGAIATDADRTPVLFSQVDFFINDQAGADFLASDEQFVSKLSVGLEIGLDQRITSEFGTRISEPSYAGGGDVKVTFGLSFSAFTDKNRRFLYDQIGKSQLKAKLVFTGPMISGSTVPYSLTVWLQGLQLGDGDINVGGFGVLPFDLSGEARTVLAQPTGFPSGLVAPYMFQLVNGLSTSYLA